MYPRFDATTRFDMIETQIPVAGGTRFQFNDQPQLRTDSTQDVVIQALEVYDVTDVTLSPSNVTVITAANLKQTYLTLYIDGEESVYRIPLIDLHVLDNFADPFKFQLQMFNNIMVDWAKSYYLTPAAYGNVAIFSILLGVHYRKVPPGTMGKLKAIEYQNFVSLQPRQIL